MKTQFIFNIKGNVSESYEFDNELKALQFARKLAFNKNLKECYYHPFLSVWVVSPINALDD
ncbi:MAG TPA: hypothetical protein VKN14_10165 [Flavobacteriaceae bacterium]|nr:hypothetical protein [Flavobacteriaceae bacterium]